MFSENVIGMFYMYAALVIFLIIGWYMWDIPFVKKLTTLLTKKTNFIWNAMSVRLSSIWSLREIILAKIPEKVKILCIVIYNVIHYILKWLTGGIFASLIAFGRPLRDLKNYFGPNLHKYYTARRKNTWNCITAILAIALIIAVLWANHIILSYLYEHGFAFAYALLILISKKISLLLLKTLSKAVGFFFGEEIRENPNLRDWINETRTSITSEYLWYLSQFNDDEQKIIKLIYWPVQIWAWGTIIILGL